MSGNFARRPYWKFRVALPAIDSKYRITWRPANALTLVARYDFQLSTLTTTPDYLSSEQSAEMTSHILSGNVSWTPWSRLYLQAGVNYVTDETETPASSAGACC